MCVLLGLYCHAGNIDSEACAIAQTLVTKLRPKDEISEKCF